MCAFSCVQDIDQSENAVKRANTTLITILNITPIFLLQEDKNIVHIQIHYVQNTKLFTNIATYKHASFQYTNLLHDHIQWNLVIKRSDKTKPS